MNRKAAAQTLGQHIAETTPERPLMLVVDPHEALAAFCEAQDSLPEKPIEVWLDMLDGSDFRPLPVLAKDETVQEVPPQDLFTKWPGQLVIIKAGPLTTVEVMSGLDAQFKEAVARGDLAKSAQRTVICVHNNDGAAAKVSDLAPSILRHAQVAYLAEPRVPSLNQLQA